MLQEVQTDITRRTENTLETIEAIGTSSRKIIINRQTRHVYSHSGITLTTSFDTFGSVDPAPGTIIPPITGVATSDSYGEIEYRLTDGKLRIPVAGQYQVTISYPTSGSGTLTTNLRVNGKKVYSKDTTGNGSYTDSMTLDLGKYDMLSVDRSYYYTVIFSGYPTQTVTVTIQNFNS